MAYEMLRWRMRNAVKGALLFQKIQIQTEELSQSNLLLQQEIEQRRIIEKSLRESESQMSAIIEANPIPLVIYREADGQLLYSNKFFLNSFGFSVDRKKAKKSTNSL